MRLRQTALLLIFVLELFGPASAQPTNLDVLDDYLQAQVEAQRVPGLALALAFADGSVDVRTYGSGITPETRFRVGSLSKAMTAAAALRLVEAELLDLDAPVRAYLPEFTTQDPDHAGRITVRHLLNQTSGLSDASLGAFFEIGALDEVVPALAAARPLAEPGATFAYFNSNYDLLGRVIEVVAEQPFDAYLREQVLIPAGMTDALAPEGPPSTIEGLTQGHILVFGFPIAYDDERQIPLPSGGVVASGRDMAAFLSQFVIEAPTLLSDDSRALMLAPPPDIDSPYGMGWFAETLTDGAPMFYHTGDLLTFHADMVLLPQEGVAFALLYNRQNLLSTFTTYSEIRTGVTAILRGEEAPGPGLTASVLGLILLVVTLIAIVSDVRRLLASPAWARKAQRPIVRAVGLLTPLIPLAILLLLPTLMLTLIGQAVDYGLLFAYLPDIMLLLMITAALGVVTVVVRAWMLLRAAAGSR